MRKRYIQRFRTFKNLIKCELGITANSGVDFDMIGMVCNRIRGDEMPLFRLWFVKIVSFIEVRLIKLMIAK